MPKSSSPGAGVTRDIPDVIERALLHFVARLRREFPEIARVIWFGSRVTGIPTRASDVDLCLVLTASDLPFIDRIARYAPRRFPCAVDVFPYTTEELQMLERERTGWIREIMRGREL